MCEYAEMYALVFSNKVMGYRVHIYINGIEETYDFQAENLDLRNWCVGINRLHRHGGLLMTNDEVKRQVKPVTVTDMSEVKYLIKQVQYFYRLREENP